MNMRIKFNAISFKLYLLYNRSAQFTIEIGKMSHVHALTFTNHLNRTCISDLIDNFSIEALRGKKFNHSLR